MVIVARQYDPVLCSQYGGSYCYSSWYIWGRWILVGVILLVFGLGMFLYICVRSRRRVRGGQKPLPYTAWMVPNGNQQPQQQGNFNNQGYNPNYNANQGGYNQGYNMGNYNQGYNQGYPQYQDQYNGQYPSPGAGSPAPGGAQNATYTAPSYPPPGHSKS